MSDDQRLIVVAVILGAHGVRGDVRVKSFTDDPEDSFKYGPLRDSESAALLDPARWRSAKDHFIVTPKVPKSKEDWDALKGAKLYVSRGALPPEAGDDEFYIEDLVGLSVLSPSGDRLGRVIAVQNYGAGDLVEIRPESGGPTVLTPFTVVDIPEVRIAARELVVADFEAWQSPD